MVSAHTCQLTIRDWPATSLTALQGCREAHRQRLAELLDQVGKDGQVRTSCAMLQTTTAESVLCVGNVWTHTQVCEVRECGGQKLARANIPQAPLTF